MGSKMNEEADDKLTILEIKKLKEKLEGRGCFNCRNFEKCKKVGILTPKLLEKIKAHPRSSYEIGCLCHVWE